ncbi:MAG TPA: diacylglycerol kinase family protein, partial [Gemmatimonadaceae bacterium]
CLIVNPAAGRGAVRATLPFVRSVFATHGIDNVYESTAPGDEESLAGQAVRDGVQTIVAVGGDGTCGRIANAILQSGAECRLAVVPTGTGNDFAKTLGVNGYAPEQVADLVVRGEATRIDVGLADRNYFLNSCGFGFDGSVLEASNRVRFLKGDAVYIYSALGQLFTYRGTEVSANGVPGVKGGRMLMVTVSNGRSLGGAFKIAPHASVLDGRLDVCFFSDSNVVERVGLFVGAMRGTHIGMPSVSTATVQQLALRFPSSPLMEVDGELRVARSRTVELRCVPRALSVVAASGALV